MAAAVVSDGEILWSDGLGDADVDGSVPAGPDTPFGLASVTKPIAAVLVMQLVEEGLVDLDDPIADYGVAAAGADGVTVRHLLTHTSEGTPGTVHRYNGNRYNLLGGVVEGATGQTFARVLSDHILLPLGMMDTALNPIGNWGDLSITGFEDFRYALGWGEAFAHYPDVYARLARPYQFDEDYSIIPGMYQLVHGPAAGLNSSVTDLATFDIALDAGILLADASRSEMFAPSVPTVTGRTDLAYGIGWYVQEFAGTRLLWHSGRWPPSTSALYLKVPEHGLTFLILANTDNLTVPFPGIGSGDLSRSLPMLTFFRHFVFPLQHGYRLPEMDWTAEAATLTAQLEVVEDPAVREFLERELWSYRQAFGSSGRFERVEVLAAVGVDAFPGSRFRFDPDNTAIAARSAIESPLPRAATFTLLARAIVFWVLIVAVSLIWMAIRLSKTRRRSAWETTVWLVATVPTGPVAPLVHQFAGGDAGKLSGVLQASVFHMTGYAVAWVIGLVFVLNAGNEPGPAAILGATLLLPFLFGLLAIRVPLLRRSGPGTFGAVARRGVVAEVITLGIAFAVFFPLVMYFDNRLYSVFPYPTSPYFWGMMAGVTLAGVAVLVGLHVVLQRRGFDVWPAARGTALELPTLRNSWWMMAGSLAIAVGALALAVNAFE
jgi:CubicO group peptidase (beta-lactamase class C family)